MRLPGLDAVVFDMDGTLFDSSWVVPSAFSAHIAELGGPVLSHDEVIASYVLGPPGPIMEHFLGRGVRPEELAAYHARLAREAASAELLPYPGVPEMLDELAPIARLGVFTNADTGNLRVLLGATGLRERFGAVVGADEVAPRYKPAPDGLELACRRLGIDPARAAYVGDSPQDLEVARRAGALPVAAAWGHLHEPTTEEITVDDPRKLPRALMDARR